nr:hypothetical protein [Azospirillum tabaci]
MNSSLGHNTLSRCSIGRLDRGHGILKMQDCLTQSLVDVLAIRAMMDTSMAGWAYPSNVARIVWTTVAHASDVMWLQVWFTISSHEWSRRLAALADAGGTREHISAHHLAALVNTPPSAFGWLLFTSRRSFHCGTPKCSQIEPTGAVVTLRFRSVSLLEPLHRNQVEDDPTPHVPTTIWCRFSGCAHTDELAEKPQHPRTMLLLEKEQILSLGDMIADGFVPRGEGHIAFLAFAEVAENLAILGPTIEIAVLDAAYPGDRKYDWVLRRRNDAALALTAVGIMEIAPAIVTTITDEVPKGHVRSLELGLCGHASSTIPCCAGVRKQECTRPLIVQLDHWAIAWSLVAPHRAQAQINHGQTLERLAERGSLAPCELLAVLEDRPHRRMHLEDAIRQIRGLIEAFELGAASVGGGAEQMEDADA